MATQYEVTAACVTHIPAATSNGPMLLTLYRGNRLPGGVPQDRLRHLLDGGMIRAVEEPGPEPVESEEEEEDEEPTLTVNSRSNKEELIEYGVAKGGNRAELDGKTVKELQALYLKGDGQPA
jgi:hypothetical protein